MPKKAPKIRLDDLVVEVTRRCNMRCEHCLRGEAEDLDMPRGYVRNLFSGVARVDVLTFTGGEPALGVPAMRAALECCEENHVHVREVYIATNGKRVDDGFIDCLRRWDAYCKECECIRPKNGCTGGTDAVKLIRALTGEEDAHVGIRIDLSMDRFHDDVPVENILKLMSLPGVLGTGKYNSETDDKWLLKTGQAEWNGMGDEDAMARRSYAYNERAMDLELSRDPDGEYAASMLYASCDGSVVKYCDYSYRDIPDYALTSLENPDWLGELVKDYYRTED